MISVLIIYPPTPPSLQQALQAAAHPSSLPAMLATTGQLQQTLPQLRLLVWYWRVCNCLPEYCDCKYRAGDDQLVTLSAA